MVGQIPRGRVATYGQIAELAGLSGQARLVGYALHNIPPNSGLPWHRVVNAKGRISLPADHPGRNLQRKRLEREGVVFIGPRLDLKRYRWKP